MIESITENNSSTREKVRNLFQWVFKNKFLSFLLVFALVKIFSYVFDTRPIKFERFKTAKELKAFLEAKYPIGSEGEVAYKALKSSSAKCYLVNTKTTQLYEFRNYGYVGWCEYSTSLFSWPPDEKYKVIVLGDKNKRIVEIHVSKFSGLVI